MFLSGWAATVSGDIAAARARVTASSETFAGIGDRRAVGYALAALGDCAVQEGSAAEAVSNLREGIAIFEALPERWGLLYSASLLAAACAALDDWPRAAMLLGVVDSLGERIGGQLFPHIQAGIDALEAAVREKLGPAMKSGRAEGMVIGRGDQITTALWPRPDQAAGRLRYRPCR